MAEPLLVIGQNVSVNGESATVRYIGTIDGSAGEWIGVEWFDPQRGKHNGSLKGKQYFKTSSELSGSFVRKKLVTDGISFEKALIDRYGDFDYIPDVPNSINYSNFGGKDIELILGKDGHYQARKSVAWNRNLRDIFLVNTPLYYIESPPGKLGELLPAVQKLTFRQTTISDFGLVDFLLSEFPHVRDVVFCEHRLSDFKSMKLSKKFENIRLLNLSEIFAEWEICLTVCASLPKLEVFICAENGISSLVVPPKSVFNDLHTLNFDGNCISDWNEVLKLGKLPCLKNLNLIGNNISTIQFPDAQPDEITEHFLNLSTLVLAQNNISTWRDCCQISKLKNLTSLAFRGNPVYVETQNENSEPRDRLIVYGPKLSSLNHSGITSEERYGAELSYVKSHYRQFVKSGGKDSLADCILSDEFLSEHPIYKKLFFLYGGSEVADVGEEAAPTISSNILHLGFSVFEHPEISTKPIKILRTGTVQTLKLIIRKQLKLKATQKFRLFYTSPATEDTQYDLDNDLKTLHFFSVEEGDTIHIHLPKSYYRAL